MPNITLTTPNYTKTTMPYPGKAWHWKMVTLYHAAMAA